MRNVLLVVCLSLVGCSSGGGGGANLPPMVDLSARWELLGNWDGTLDSDTIGVPNQTIRFTIKRLSPPDPMRMLVEIIRFHSTGGGYDLFPGDLTWDGTSWYWRSPAAGFDFTGLANFFTGTAAYPELDGRFESVTGTTRDRGTFHARMATRGATLEPDALVVEKDFGNDFTVRVEVRR